jgi:hypothetical protein
MVQVRHRLYLADNLWLTAHEDRYGKCYVSPLALGLGLAGGLLAELVLWRHLEVGADGELEIPNMEDRIGPAMFSPIAVEDPLSAQILHRIMAERSKPAGDRAMHVSGWLRSLSPNANSMVTKRLLDKDVIRRVEYTRRFRKPVVRHEVINVNDGSAPASNITGRLARREPIDRWYLAFAGFALATGLERQLLRDTPEVQRRYLGTQLAGLWPSLRCLIAETDSAVGNAAFTHRG